MSWFGQDSEQGDGGAHPSNRLARTVFVSVPRLIIGALILAGIAINFANVVSRHLFSAAIFWTEEILVFLVIWTVLVAAIAITYRGGHLRMDLFVTNIRRPWKEVINALTIAAFIVFCSLVVVQSFDVVSAFHRNGTVSIAANLPLTIPHSALLVGFTAMVLAVLVRWRAYFRGRFDDDE